MPSLEHRFRDITGFQPSPGPAGESTLARAITEGPSIHGTEPKHAYTTALFEALPGANWQETV